MDSARKVLAIEDDEAVLFYIRVVLERHGFQVLSALDGKSGLMMAALHQPDAIVSDYHMPEMNGLQLLEKLRDDPDTAPIPIILLSVEGSAALRRRCLEAGARAVLEKPFAPEQLLSTIQEILS